MPTRFVWNIAAPMFGLGAVLLGLGVAAAWNVHKQQQTTSELIAREVSGMLVIEELHMEMREIRYQVNLFLRTRDRRHLASAAALHDQADLLLHQAKTLARTGREQELIEVVEAGYRHFFDEFQSLSANLLPTRAPAEGGNFTIEDVSPELSAALTHLSDEVLTDEVLQPLRECIDVNKQVVERTNEASQLTAQHLKIGFLLLGLCGGAAGLLMGTGISRAVRRSMIQLNVSIRGVVGRLSDVTGPVTFSHNADMAGIESGLRKVEQDIEQVVERLQQREMEVLRSEQLARVGQLAAGLAHELRNPLMPMKMLVQAAIERGDAAGLQGRSLHVINDEISRMEHSIQVFLDFARPPIPEKAVVDVVETLRLTIDLVAPRARQQGVALQLQLPERPVPASVDRSQIRQLVLNLLLNALDVLPSGGIIEVELFPHALPPNLTPPEPPAPLAPPIDRMNEHDALRLASQLRPIQPRVPKSWFALRIADNGPGIADELLETLFDPFVTTKETGVGLGLSICQRIVQAHNGVLTVRNRVRGGAEFLVRLPREETAVSK